MLWNNNFITMLWRIGWKAILTVHRHQSRSNSRNHEWIHLFNNDVLSMPDKWEYLVCASLAFHVIVPSAWWRTLPNGNSCLTRMVYASERSQRMNGFSDVNPPVHAWAAWRSIDWTKCMGVQINNFWNGYFKLLLNFTWWVNRGMLKAKISSGRLSRHG